MSILARIGGAALGSPPALWALGIGAASLISAIGVQTWRLHSLEASCAMKAEAWAEEREKLANAAQAAEHRQRLIEDQRRQDVERIANDATTRIAAAHAAASAADAARDRMQLAAQQAAAAARRRGSGSHPAAAGSGAAASDPIGVLADVLGRADAAAGVYAAIADQRGLRGQACERAYEALRAP